MSRGQLAVITILLLGSALALPLLFEATSARAQVAVYPYAYDQCTDFRGRTVLSFENRKLNDVAAASFQPDRTPIIYYNPSVLQNLAPQTRLFVYGHECGHHALGHFQRGRFLAAFPYSLEQEADCFGIVAIYKLGLVGESDLAVIQKDLNNAGPGDWMHLPGPQRAINLRKCLAAGGLAGPGE